MAKLILALAGEMGSGKGVITKHIVQNFDANSFKFSQIFRDILDRAYIEKSRENISKLSFILRKNFGEDVLAKSMYNDVQADGHEIVVIDGVRRMEDIVFLQELPEFKLVYVEADLKTCYERLVRRAENPGDATKTFEQFKKDHEADADARIVELKNHSDYLIENNGTYEQLFEKINQIIKKNIN